MIPVRPTWRVLRTQQELSRSNARQALLVIQQRRRDLAEAERALPLVPDGGLPHVDGGHRTRSTRRSSHTGSVDS